MNVLVYVTLLFSVLLHAHAYRILGLFPHPGKSHFHVFQPLMQALAEKGHDVTVVSHFPIKQKVDRYKDISLATANEPLVEFIDMDVFKGRRSDMYFLPLMLSYFAKETCNKGLEVQEVQDLIKSDEKFDLIITEFFNTDCFSGFVHKFKTPVISLSSATMMPWLNARFANPDNPSYIPNNFMDYSDRLSFLERVENTVIYIFHNFVYYILMDIPSNKAARKHFGDDLPPLSEIVYNTSLMLINTHFSLNLPRPQVPGVIDVGGMHIKKPKKPPQVRLPLNYITL